MNDFDHVIPVADTAYCIVRESVYAPPSRPGYVQKCALKTAKRDDPATRTLMKGEFDRLSRLVEIGREDESPLVPAPVALEVVNGRTQLLMEWVDGVPLDEQTSRGKPNPATPLYAVESLRRILTLLAFVHKKTGLDAALPDFKRDAIILAARGVRVLDWNVLHNFSEDGAARDFQLAIQYMVELAVGSRLGSFAAAGEALKDLRGGLETELLKAVFEYAYGVARQRADREQMLMKYEQLIELCEGYEEALLYLQWVTLGISQSQGLKVDIQTALETARQRSAVAGPPVLELEKRSLKLHPLRAGPANRGQESERRVLERLVTMFAEAGAISTKQFSVFREGVEHTASHDANSPANSKLSVQGLPRRNLR